MENGFEKLRFLGFLSNFIQNIFQRILILILICEFCYFIENDVTKTMVYGMFFLSRKILCPVFFVRRNLKKFLQTLGLFQPWLERTSAEFLGPIKSSPRKAPN